MKIYYLKFFLNKFTFVSVLVLFTSSSCISQKNQPVTLTESMKNQEHYPKIEHYSEIDLGRSNAGSYKWEVSGKTVYGGLRDYQPHILRETFYLNNEQINELLN